MERTDKERFTELYVAHYPRVVGYCLRRLGPDEAHDATAETFTVAWRRIGDVPEGERALPWLYAVAARTVLNQHRSRRRRRGLREKLRGLGQVRDPEPDVQIVRRSEDQRIIDAINRLRGPDREVLLLSAWDGLSAVQLASRFGISHKAAEQRLTRAKRRLASEIGRVEKHFPVAGPRFREGWSK